MLGYFSKIFSDLFHSFLLCKYQIKYSKCLFVLYYYRLNLTSQSPGRESRASMSASGSGRVTPGRRATPLRAARKRTLLDESEERSLQDFSVTSSAKGDLEVAEACPEGAFVKIRNKGKKVRQTDSLTFKN